MVLRDIHFENLGFENDMIYVIKKDLQVFMDEWHSILDLLRGFDHKETRDK